MSEDRAGEGLPERIYVADLSGEGDFTWVGSLAERPARDDLEWSEYVRASPALDVLRASNALNEALGHLQCGCSVKERMSGHLIDCAMPQVREAMDALDRAALRGPAPDASGMTESFRRGHEQAVRGEVEELDTSTLPTPADNEPLNGYSATLPASGYSACGCAVTGGIITRCSAHKAPDAAQVGPDEREALRRLADRWNGRCPEDDEKLPRDPIEAAGYVYDLCATELRARLLRGSPEQEEGRWRTIESAPRDGRLLILADGNVSYFGEWYTNGRCWVTARLHARCEPTHWMPLPTAPEGDLNG